MAAFKAHKTVAALPERLEPDCLYFVRAGSGFDLYVSDHTGQMAHALNQAGFDIDFAVRSQERRIWNGDGNIQNDGEITLPESIAGKTVLIHTKDRNGQWHFAAARYVPPILDAAQSAFSQAVSFQLNNENIRIRLSQDGRTVKFFNNSGLRLTGIYIVETVISAAAVRRVEATGGIFNQVKSILGD